MDGVQKHFSKCLLATATSALFACAASAFAGDAQLNGAAAQFAILSAAPNGAGAISCTNSVVSGDVGSSGSVTQSGCTISGAVVAPVSADVLADFDNTYAGFANLSCTAVLQDSYANTTFALTPGVYCNSGGGDVTFANTTLTLDAQGDPNAVWVFKIGTGGSGKLAGSNFSVAVANGARSTNVSWVANAVTITTPGLRGTILAGAAASISGTNGSYSPLNGKVLARAAVTLADIAVSAAVASDTAQSKCNQGVGNGAENCDPANSNQGSIYPFGSNDEYGGVPGNPGRKAKGKP